MKYIYKITGFVIFSCMITICSAQQDAQYTQYMYNTMSVNPAYAGSRGTLSITGLHRSQWVGLAGAPKTQTLTISSPIEYRNRMGLGLSVINDSAGPIDETYINVDYSYTVKTSEKGKLSFGLKAVAHLLNVDLQGLSLLNQNDNIFENNVDNKFSPNFGLGLYYHTDKFYFGASAPSILETKHFDKSSISSNSQSRSILAEERINYYIIAGHVFDLSDNVKLKPTILNKIVFGSPFQIDFSANFLFHNKFILGAAYRLDAAVSAMAGFQMSKPFMIGLAYDREITELGRTEFNDGSFELILRYEIFPKKIRMVPPRFF